MDLTDFSTHKLNGTSGTYFINRPWQLFSAWRFTRKKYYSRTRGSVVSKVSHFRISRKPRLFCLDVQVAFLKYLWNWWNTNLQFQGSRILFCAIINANRLDNKVTGVGMIPQDKWFKDSPQDKFAKASNFCKCVGNISYLHWFRNMTTVDRTRENEVIQFTGWALLFTMSWG